MINFLFTLLPIFFFSCEDPENLKKDQPLIGCTDSLAINYDSLASIDDGDCDYFGCTDSSAGNYDSQDPQDKHVLMPEYLTCIDRSPALAGHVVAWLTDEAQHERIVKDLTILKEQVAQGGASELAAEYITQLMLASVNPAQAA